MITAPIFAINRHRMGTDGPGITTLVCFMGCRLSCKYCINDRCHDPIYEKDGVTPRAGVMILSPKELYDKVKIDNLYFQTTGGGITFGGGEPTLYPDFIKEFKSLCGDKWKINLETSAYCSGNTIRDLSSIVDNWFVDIKSMDPFIYRSYTGRTSPIDQTLRSMLQLIPTERITIRVPKIPKYTDNVDFERDIKTLKELGFNNIDHFEYTIKL